MLTVLEHTAKEIHFSGTDCISITDTV